MALLSPRSVVATSALVLAMALMACMPAPAVAQINTGESNRCCAFIPVDASASTWQLVCNDPRKVGGAKDFPPGTIVSGVVNIPGSIVQCVGQFPTTGLPNGYQLPATGRILNGPPNGAPPGARCASQFKNFFQSIGPNGAFVVQCTN